MSRRLFITAILTATFYFFFINLTSDAVMLFLSNKLFLGHWLSKGTFPLYNPYIYAGVPFAFDLGLGNLHPFNLLFMLPYPFSMSLWVFANSLLFLYGFFHFLRQFTKDERVAVLGTLILFFSGSGVFISMGNPTIFSVITHYGIFFYSLSFLKRFSLSSLRFPLLVGILLTLSGHIQFVFYAYLFGFFLSVFVYKIPWLKVVFYYILLFIATSWFYLFALPIVLDSTRIGTSLEFGKIGALRPQQLIQFVFPFFFGEALTGARWNAGPSPNIIISTTFSLFLTLLILFRRMRTSLLLTLLLILTISLGLVSIPFFRLPAQIMVLFHIVGVTLIVSYFDFLEKKVLPFLDKKTLYRLIVVTFMPIIFFYTSLFPSIFFSALSVVKKSPGLFYDYETVKHMGFLIGGSFLPYLFLLFMLRKVAHKKSTFFRAILLFVIIEGIFLNVFHNYFVPAQLFTKSGNVPHVIDQIDYRVQTTADVIPYSGFHNYIENVYFRPPFSKEKTMFDEKERQTFNILKEIMYRYSGSWGARLGIRSVQGYNTFVPQALADFFATPSASFREEYHYIIEKNPTFANVKSTSHINAIDTSRITPSDPRWEQLGVRYWISDRPLPYFEQTFHGTFMYVYENLNAKYRYTHPPLYENPNGMYFNITRAHNFAPITFLQNPSGFVAKLNGKEIPIQKEPLQFTITPKEEGFLEIYYSPWEHLKEVWDK